NPGPRRNPATGFRTLRPVAAAGGRRLLGPAVRPNDDEERDRRHPPDGRADGPGGYPRHEPLRRREAAARDRDVPRGTSGARLPRRADDRTRPQRTAGAVGPDSSTQEGRHHDPPDDPLSRRGGTARRR